MAVFDRIPKDVIARDFTHYGWFLGILPIYFNEQNTCVAVRNWVPEWTLDALQGLLDISVHLMQAFSPAYELGGFPIKLTGEIEK